ncbi:unnamed protein product [Ectocarpus sp. CCAP 1310/34]|nr:unnamed protein product [Ectocarpus sp. CCAP 1310/34]
MVGMGGQMCFLGALTGYQVGAVNRPGPRTEGLRRMQQKIREALNRACLVRELQLLFLHVMGEARAVSLGPGMVTPPPLAEHAPVLAEAYCCNDKDKEALESSLCPLARANVDLGMMEGACKGSSRVILQRSVAQPAFALSVTVTHDDWELEYLLCLETVRC